MKEMGRYCKAYSVSKFREFSGWTENVQNLRKETNEGNGNESSIKGQLTDTDYLYVQDNYTVTQGIFFDENVIYDSISSEWVAFCKDTLKFEIPHSQPPNLAKA